MKFFISAILIVCFGLHGFSQAPSNLPIPPAGVAYSITYEEEEKMFYTVPEGTELEKLSPLDVLKLEKSVVRKQVENRVLDDGASQMIVTILNPEEAYADWPKPVGRYEIDENEIRVYNPAGVLMQSIMPDSAMSAMQEGLKELHANTPLTFQYEFPAMDQEKITELENQGKEVAPLGNGAYKIEDSLKYQVYDPAYKRIFTRFNDLHTGGEVRQWKVFFTTSYGIIMPAVERTTTQVIRPSGACMQRVLEKKYSNYEIKVAEKLQERHRQVVESGRYLGLFPNPAQHQISVNLDATVLPGSVLQVLDALGKTVYSQTDMQPESVVSVDLAARAPGVYYVRVQTTGGPHLMKFIKQ